jgi:hypothetical protein
LSKRRTPPSAGAALWIYSLANKDNIMQIAKARARRKASLKTTADPLVIAWLMKRHRVRRPIALIVAHEAGLGAR